MCIRDSPSTAQLFYFIYSALRNFAAKNNCIASNTNSYAVIYKNILNLHNKAQREGWTIHKYNRLYHAKSSELFKLVASNLLNIGNDLFYEIIALP